MCHVPTVAAFAIALLPVPVLAQVEPASGPVPADDLTPYPLGTHMRATSVICTNGSPQLR